MNGADFWESCEYLGTRILVKKYIRPEKIGSIYVSDAYRTDNSRALWEVVKSNTKANKYIGLELEKDDLVITLPNRGAYIGYGGEHEELYTLFAEEIVQYIQNTWKYEDDAMGHP